MKKILSVIAAALMLSSCGCNKDNDTAISETDNSGNTVEFPMATGRNNVIYELNVGSFTAEGTFKAAEAHLSELKDLGIDIVWLMPIYPRGGGIDSPYAATDFKATNPKYGEISDLKSLVSKAHTLGMEVWLDWVPNHTATDAKWVTSNPEYYTKENGKMVHPNNYGDVFQLDYTNPDLAAAMTNCLKFWVDEADVDGFRCDYVSSPKIPASYWETAIPEVKNHKADKTITFLAEGDISQSNNKALSTTGFEYDYAWDFQEGGLQNTVGKGVSGTALQKVCEELLNKTQAIAPVKRMLYITNHDQNYNDGGKLIENVYGENRYPLTALVFTLTGMPLVYNGQEVGGKQILDYFHDTKINWNDKDEKMYNIVKNISKLKHSTDALREDAQTIINTADKSQVFAFTRGSGQNAALVIINLGTDKVSTKISGIASGNYTVKYDGGVSVEKISQQLSDSQEFEIQGKGFLVLVK
ncbi:MAG: hypothetical protein IJ150_07300 [Bacteroidales bacterium]|nr:hypothetical protein [Bacteroidales bacterium]